MNLTEAMHERHSVRSYTSRPIEGETLEALKREIDACNRESGLHIQLVRNEPMAFDSFMAHYGKFSGVKNYLALVGKKSRTLDEACGYYGETQGTAYKSKDASAVSRAADAPEWFNRGVEAALLAPTAVNQQKFLFTLHGDKVSAKAGLGFFSKVDLGIAKYHFELGSGRDRTVWL